MRILRLTSLFLLVCIIHSCSESDYIPEPYTPSSTLSKVIEGTYNLNGQLDDSSAVMNWEAIITPMTDETVLFSIPHFDTFTHDGNYIPFNIEGLRLSGSSKGTINVDYEGIIKTQLLDWRNHLTDYECYVSGTIKRDETGSSAQHPPYEINMEIKLVENDRGFISERRIMLSNTPSSGDDSEIVTKIEGVYIVEVRINPLSFFIPYGTTFHYDFDNAKIQISALNDKTVSISMLDYELSMNGYDINIDLTSDLTRRYFDEIYDIKYKSVIPSGSTGLPDLNCTMRGIIRLRENEDESHFNEEYHLEMDIFYECDEFMLYFEVGNPKGFRLM